MSRAYTIMFFFTHENLYSHAISLSLPRIQVYSRPINKMRFVQNPWDEILRDLWRKYNDRVRDAWGALMRKYSFNLYTHVSVCERDRWKVEIKRRGCRHKNVGSVSKCIKRVYDDDRGRRHMWRSRETAGLGASESEYPASRGNRKTSFCQLSHSSSLTSWRSGIATNNTKFIQVSLPDACFYYFCFSHRTITNKSISWESFG